MSILKIAAISAVLVLFGVLSACSVESSTTPILENELLTVYKSPTCGCCSAWVEHASTEGFSTTISKVEDIQSVKDSLGVRRQYRACHTAVSAEGYVFEGHIPAKAIQTFLEKKPEGAIGLAVPGMPMGSPGMEQNDAFTPYQVLQLMKDGSSVPYLLINTQKEQYQ